MPAETPLRILRLRAVQVATGLAASSIYQLVKDRAFPPPLKLSERRSGWLKSEIDAWIESRIKERQASLDRLGARRHRQRTTGAAQSSTNVRG